MSGLFALKVLTGKCIFLHFHSSLRCDQKADIFFFYIHTISKTVTCALHYLFLHHRKSCSDALAIPGLLIKQMMSKT